MSASCGPLCWLRRCTPGARHVHLMVFVAGPRSSEPYPQGAALDPVVGQAGVWHRPSGHRAAVA
eukprot:2886826-Alexandrium_andersonii.AAC.1